MEQSRNIKYSRRIIIQWIRINSLPPFYRSAWGVENIVYPSTQVFSNMPRIVFKGAPIGFAIKLVHAKVNRPKLYSEGCRFCKRLRRQMRCPSHATNVLPSNNMAWKLKMKARLNCGCENVTCLIQCNAHKKQYVGKTTTTLSIQS